SGAMRSSVYYMVPLLLHGGAVSMPLPGGCRIGTRPIDLHLAGLCAMGVTFTHEGETLRCTAPNGLQGTRFCLSFPSVGATETLMMAASLARGRTVLHGCAREPEVLDLACFLQCCGANIRGAGGDCITIEGVRALHGVRYVPIADRIAAATVLFAVCACGGDVTLCDVQYEHLISVVRTLEAMGAVLERPEQGKLRIRVAKPLRAAAVTTGVYPAFPTDAGPLFAAACLGAEGESSITETIFEHRFACADEFRKLGARLHCEERCLQIHGAAALTGARLYAEDLRGGAALVIAALAANGESRIENAEYIRRGYADIALLFRGLGAAIEQCES
ncbi:MAG: UDP-N-acetylglucosamine 1-carboxyvinyltransferase, partial [Pygmaiobacter sp.]